MKNKRDGYNVNILLILETLINAENERKTSKIKNKQGKIKNSLINSIEEIETKGLEQLMKTTGNPNDAVELVKKLDNLTKRRKNNIAMLAYRQGKVFQNFKINNKFASAVTEFGTSKTTVNFKIVIVNFIGKYPKMIKSCILLFYLKNNFRAIKNVCQKHTSEFK